MTASDRLTTYRDGRYAAHFIELPREHDGPCWYIWDLRLEKPWWNPERVIPDAPDLDARVVLERYLEGAMSMLMEGSVFLVSEGNYDGWSLVAAFSTRENADEFARNSPPTWGRYRIEEVPLDKWQQRRHQKVWKVEMYDDFEGDPPIAPWAVELRPDLRSMDDNASDSGIPMELRVAQQPYGWMAMVVAENEQQAIRVGRELVEAQKARLASLV